MRLALYSQAVGGRDPGLWAGLPGLCCQAAGGQAAWADPVSAGWLMFYAAAHLMDCVEDCDKLDPWCAEGGPGLALNAATGLYFSACLALQKLTNRPVLDGAQLSAAELVLRPFLVMGSGQYADFAGPPAGLEEYWRVAEAKSGAFFALACQAGASLASSDPAVLEGFRQYGQNLGVIIQILDDLADFRDLRDDQRALTTDELQRSLLTVYFSEVCTSETLARYKDLLDQAAAGRSTISEIAEMIEQNGGTLYLQTELEIRQRMARLGLDRASASEPARSKLLALLNAVAG